MKKSITRELKMSMGIIFGSIAMMYHCTKNISLLDEKIELCRKFNLSPDIIYQSVLEKEDYATAVFVWLGFLSVGMIKFVFALKDFEKFKIEKQDEKRINF